MASLATLNSPGSHPVRKISHLSAPRNSNENAVFELQDSLVEWSKETRVKEAWERLAEREGFDREIFYLASWAFADAAASFQHEVMLDMSKARKSGFYGTVETSEDFVEALRARKSSKKNFNFGVVHNQWGYSNIPL